MEDKLIASERMKDFYKDVQHWVDYDFVVINDNLNECYDEISQLIDLSLKPKFIAFFIKKTEFIDLICY